MKTLHIGSTKIVLDGELTLTVLHDNATIPARPQNNSTYRARAQSLGYGTDTARMSREHEILHSLLARWLRLPESPTMRHLTKGKLYPDWQLEEATVLALAAFANAAGVDVESLAE